jgi:hypothetical protein
LDFPGEKLVIKLWETLAEKGIGSLLSPWQAQREGKVRNDLRRQELLMLAQAEVDAAEVRAGRKRLRDDGTLAALPAPVATDTIGSFANGDRREPTLGLPEAVAAATAVAVTDAARREINSAKAVLFAEEQLANDPQEPPDRPVDDDWLFAWRDYAGRISSEDLQRLWGSVLAGEIKSPGRHSMRTLEFLRGISRPEAELIERLAQFVVGSRIVRSQADYMTTHGLSFDHLLRLQELGVVFGVEALGLTTQYKTNIPGRFIQALVSHGKVLIVEHADGTKQLAIEIYGLTTVGAQVLGLGSFKPDLGYLRAVGKGIAAQGFDVKLCDWQQIDETQGRFSNPEQIDA